MDPLQILAAALSSNSASDMLTSVGVYAASPLTVHIYLQWVKYERRERKLPPVGNWTLRCAAMIGTFGLAWFVGHRLGGWPVGMAADHAISVAIFYPLSMWALMSWLKWRYPDAYRKLAPRRRRASDKPDLDDTSELFM